MAVCEFSVKFLIQDADSDGNGDESTESDDGHHDLQDSSIPHGAHGPMPTPAFRDSYPKPGSHGNNLSEPNIPKGQTVASEGINFFIHGEYYFLEIFLVSVCFYYLPLRKRKRVFVQ